MKKLLTIGTVFVFAMVLGSQYASACAGCGCSAKKAVKEAPAAKCSALKEGEKCENCAEKTCAKKAVGQCCKDAAAKGEKCEKCPAKVIGQCCKDAAAKGEKCETCAAKKAASQTCGAGAKAKSCPFKK